ncbi:hypothetical protein GCM10023231_10300 [Olivibacter ginsenosidimutans]|uniref:SDR family oxidoreductase n=1 Tax=Olivibacter ginsenosidimutans TaxID=1176537 RepID=A0ABP9AQB4_9SPHI
MIKGNYALITGATKGIGKRIAFALAQEGCHLMLVARTAKDLQALTEELRWLNPNVQVAYRVVDCRDQLQVKALANDTIRVFPYIGILVNNVGLFKPGKFLDEDEQNLSEHLAINVLCTHYLSVFFGRRMCAKGSGHIFNIGSIAGKQPFAKAASYSVTKYAVHGLTAVLRQEFGVHGVKVTEIIPGSTYTASWEGVDIPEAKFVAADDIAQAVLMCLTISGGANVDELVIRPLDLDV